MQDPNRRIVHLTFYKAASWWVRDILSNPEISLISGFPLSFQGVDVGLTGWPDQAGGTFAGPLYVCSPGMWEANRKGADQAVVVVRDPRDIVVSAVFSIGFSHMPSSVIRLLRDPIVAASGRHRLMLGMHLLTLWEPAMRGWTPGCSVPGAYVVDYAKLIATPAREFSAIFDFLNWSIPAGTLQSVLDRNSFLATTGRKPGEENQFSHQRKGVAGDWKNYFDRELGMVFEESFPGLLVQMGYERENNWFLSLPERLETTRPDAEKEQSLIESLQERVAMLERDHAEIGQLRSLSIKWLTDLEQLNRAARHWERTAEERLRDVRTLTALVRTRENREPTAAPPM